jgi:hypothetical protein
MNDHKDPLVMSATRWQMEAARVARERRAAKQRRRGGLLRRLALVYRAIT